MYNCGTLTKGNQMRDYNEVDLTSTISILKWHFFDKTRLIQKLQVALLIAIVVMFIELVGTNKESWLSLTCQGNKYLEFIISYVLAFSVTSLIPIYDALFGAKISDTK
jgi:hypothetical protein